VVFADTGALYALAIESDTDHASAIQWLNSTTERLLITNFVFDELMTLMGARGFRNTAIQFGTNLINETFATHYQITDDDFLKAWHIFIKFADKEWSFTDCTSKHVIEKLGISAAFTFDHHFRQFGNVQVVP
jgi:predicted nucleic acid-binding protein